MAGRLLAEAVNYQSGCVDTYVHEVDECITDAKNGRSTDMSRTKPVEHNSLAVVGKVDAEVHEVILAPARLVHYSLEHSLVDLVGDVSQHDLSM